MRRHFALIAFCLTSTAAIETAAAQEVSAAPDFSYADLADITLPAPIVARAEIKRVRRVNEERAIGLAPGHVRFYVEAELSSLIRSEQAVPRRVNYLVDAPLQPDGRRPRLKNREVIFMAQPVQGRAASVQLIAPNSQITWTEQREAAIRQILTEAANPDAPGVVTGVGSAFSVPGSLPGESETQIFLSTSAGRPVSLSILRRPNQRPRWNVALGEIVDRASPPPQRNTLLWYRLACFLPDRLPASSLEATDGSQMGTAQADYQIVMEDLGACQRNRG